MVLAIFVIHIFFLFGCDHLILNCYLIVDATLTQEVEKFVSNKSLLNPDIDTSVTIFGRHSGESANSL